MERADVVIAGGGAAGLTLACHLAATGAGGRVLVVDDGSRPLRERLWAFWSREPRLTDPAVSLTFSRLAVHACGSHRVLDLTPYRYRVVRGADLLALTEAVTGAGTGVELVHGHVDGARETPDGVVSGVDGREIRATWLLDSVGLPGTRAPCPAAVMAFQGWEIEAGPGSFDPGLPTFYDFRATSGSDGTFGYVLPLAADRAIVELTRIEAARTGRGQPEDRSPGELPDPAGYLRETLGIARYRVTRVESGRLPLDPRQERPAGRHVLRVGAAGGQVKASTGYAFDRIQRDSAAIAACLGRHGHPFAAPRRRTRHRFLDATFLRAVLGDPGLLERTLAALARDPVRLLRFLDEDSTLREEAGLVRSMPAGAFARAGAVELLARGRRAGPALRSRWPR